MSLHRSSRGPLSATSNLDGQSVRFRELELKALPTRNPLGQLVSLPKLSMALPALVSQVSTGTDWRRCFVRVAGQRESEVPVTASAYPETTEGVKDFLTYVLPRFGWAVSAVREIGAIGQPPFAECTLRPLSLDYANITDLFLTKYTPKQSADFAWFTRARLPLELPLTHYVESSKPFAPVAFRDDTGTLYRYPSDRQYHEHAIESDYQPGVARFSRWPTSMTAHTEFMASSVIIAEL